MLSNHQDETLRRIADQEAVVAALEPASPHHAIASQILLMLRQMDEIDQAVARLRACMGIGG